MQAILTDITKCVGCRKCVGSCQSINACAPERPEQKAQPEELFNTRYTTIVRKTNAASEPRFVRRHCRHCLNPACVSVCPVGALKKTPAGPVIYDKRRCMGCRYCMFACPFGIPRSEWESLAPGIKKCTFCFEKTQMGGQPACTEACPEGATIYGQRDTLLTEARQRISNEPERYLHKIYGEHELGGTSVIYLSDINLDFLSFDKDLSDVPAPELTWKFIKETPFISGAVGLSVGFLYWLWKRKLKLTKGSSIG